ncbi:MAG: recombinase RecA [Patescibacteria group bacterium]|nr:recombinase RecA [Patescibacteria group bacterium]MCL5257810.1 recombinase RecA [Patescibacteria group bacterium]
MKKKTQAEQADKKESIQELISEIQKEFGEGAIMTLDGTTRVDVDVIPTGSPSLDLALGVGGLPRGRVIEIYGAESSGKTTLALEAISEAQKRGGQVAFIDAEHALDPEYAKRIGVDIKKILISQPDSGEEALNLAEKLIRSGLFDLVVIDSVAALTPRAELEGEMGDRFIGLQARLMSQALRKLTAVISKTKTVLIFINQIRAQIGIGPFMAGPTETTPGGKALKFFSSVRVELKRIAQIKRGEEVIGSRVRAKVVKNKVAAPFRVAEFEIYYLEGISYEADLINLAERAGLVKKTGLTYFFGETKLGGNFQASRDFLKQESKIAKQILDEIKKKNQ